MVTGHARVQGIALHEVRQEKVHITIRIVLIERIRIYAAAYLHVLGLVLLASHFWNAVLVHPSIGSVRITAVAAACMTAVDQHLNRWNHISHRAVGGDLDTISDGRHRGMGPTRSTTKNTSRQ